MKNVILYYKPTCPFCAKVLAFMEANGISLPLKDISQSDVAREELLALGGKIQVPCLDIDGQALYESDDIITWLDQNLAEVSQ